MIFGERQVIHSYVGAARGPITIVIDEVADALARSSDEPLAAHLDLRDGSVVYEPDENWGYVDEDLARAFEEEPKRFLLIPRSGSHDEYSWMESFVDSIVDDDEARDRLADAIRGKGAFGRFRNMLRDYPELRERWFALRTERLADAARAWLEGEDVAYVEKRRVVQEPQVQAEQPPRKEKLPLAIVHVLLLGEGERDVVEGKVRRVVRAGSRNPRELFKLLARDLCAMNGIDWRNRFIEGKDMIEHGGIRVSCGEADITVEVEVPEAIRPLFERR